MNGFLREAVMRCAWALVWEPIPTALRELKLGPPIRASHNGFIYRSTQQTVTSGR